MKTTTLEDFQKWKDLNKGNKFSLFDYLFHITKLNKLSTDIYFAFLEMFWPNFVVYKNYIILNGNFSEEKIEDLIRTNEKVEYWMNLFITDPFFENDEDGDERAGSLAKFLVDIWKTKLKNDFPTKDFVVEYVCDAECGDHGLTFYQK